MTIFEWIFSGTIFVAIMVGIVKSVNKCMNDEENGGPIILVAFLYLALMIVIATIVDHLF
jgi:ABC-type Na+ efflux pump permease subunit